WVIRPEREGEPKDAFQIEEIEVPEPGAFEAIVRVMSAGVNFNNVWASLGKPVSVFGYGDHKEYGHHIGGSDASGVVWKVGAGANAVGVVSSDEKGELVKQLGAVGYINRREFAEMMRSDANHPAADPAADKERFAASRAFGKRVKEVLGDAPDIVFEHVGQAT